MTSFVGSAVFAPTPVFAAPWQSAVGSAALQRASQFLGATTYQRASELGIPAYFANHPANHGGLCATFVSSILSQCGFPDLSISVQPGHAFPDVLRGALLARGFTPVPFVPSPPPGSIVLWPNNEHAAFFVRGDATTMVVLSSNNDHRAIPQTVRFDTHIVALEQRAMVLRPPL